MCFLFSRHQSAVFVKEDKDDMCLGYALTNELSNAVKEALKQEGDVVSPFILLAQKAIMAISTQYYEMFSI